MVEKLISTLEESGAMKAEDRELVKQGLTNLLATTLWFITIAVLGMVFGAVIEAFIFFLFFYFLRTFSGGYHCKSSKNCYILSVLSLVSILLLINHTPESSIGLISVISTLISIPVIFQFAPVEARTKPLDAEEKVQFRKKALSHLAVEILLMIILLSIGQLKLGFIVSIAISLSAFLIIVAVGRLKLTKASHST